MNQNIEAIKNMEPSTSRKEGRKFIGVIQSEDVTVSQRGRVFETIAINTSNPDSENTHKKSQDNQQEMGFPNKVGNTATNFTAMFSKIGYFGIKRWLDKEKMNYSQGSIVQASNLKEILEELKVNREEVKIASVDKINMYPSIKLARIRKAVGYFARKLTVETKKTINLYLELIHIGMRSTLISFEDKYYEYHIVDREEQGLSIGGCDPAFLADLVASYLFV